MKCLRRPTAGAVSTGWPPPGVTLAKLWARPVSGGLPAAADKVRQGRNDTLAGNVEAAAQIVPERHAMLRAGLGEAEEGIAAIACQSRRAAAGQHRADQLLRRSG
jgi:hypothetical protein